MPDDWTEHVNQTQSTEELETLRNWVIRGQPFGSAAWVANTLERYGIQSIIYTS
jgi:Na+/H+-dicarboxylate symporter